MSSVRTQEPAANDIAEASIRAVVARYVEAREARDAKALATLFTPEVDQLTSSGEWRRGRNEVVRGVLASSQRTGGTRSISIQTVRFPLPSVAIVDGRYEISGLAGGAVRALWTTFMLTKSPEGWHITAIRNMLPAAPVPDAARKY